jgi:hypothetical protein
MMVEKYVLLSTPLKECLSMLKCSKHLYSNIKEA